MEGADFVDAGHGGGESGAAEGFEAEVTGGKIVEGVLVALRGVLLCVL